MSIYKPLTLLLMGVTAGLLFADVFAHWNGWHGPQTLSIIATVTGFSGAVIQFAAPKSQKPDVAPPSKVV